MQGKSLLHSSSQDFDLQSIPKGMYILMIKASLVDRSVKLLKQ